MTSKFLLSRAESAADRLLNLVIENEILGVDPSKCNEADALLDKMYAFTHLPIPDKHSSRLFTREYIHQNMYYSKDALKLVDDGLTPKEITPLVRVEHQESKSALFKWVTEFKHSLSPKEIVERVKKFPVVIITREEDKRLTKLGLRVAEGENRYRQAGISVVVLDNSPYPIKWKNR